MPILSHSLPPRRFQARVLFQKLEQLRIHRALRWRSDPGVTPRRRVGLTGGPPPLTALQRLMRTPLLHRQPV